MIEKIADRIAKLQVKYPLYVLIVFLVISLALIPGIFNLVGNVEPSLEKVLPQHIDEIETMNDMRAQFGADMMYLLLYAEDPISDVRNPEFVEYVDQLANSIKEREYILEVNTVADIIKQQNQGIIPDSLTEIKYDLADHPLTSRYINPDYSLSVIRITSDTGSSAELINKVVTEIKQDIEFSQSFNPGSKIQLTGFNAIDKATFEVIIKDFQYITLVSFLLIGIVVLVTFRSFTKGFLPLTVVMVALLWTIGIVGYFNFTITVVTMVAAAMIMGLGIDFGIHMVHTYYEKRKKEKPKKALQKTLRELLRAMVGASLTTTAGFLALLFGVLPAMQNLGIILAIGIMSTLTGAIFLLPVLVYLNDTRGA